MADTAGAATPGDDDDAWVARLRDALTDTAESTDPAPEPERRFEIAELPDEPEPTPEPTPEPDLDPEPEPEPPDPRIDQLHDDVREMRDVLAELVRRTTTVERVARSEPSTSQALDQSIVDTVKAAMLRAQATGEGTTRLEAEVRVLEESVRKLTKQVNELNLTALARDRLEKDAHIETLAAAAEQVSHHIERATSMQRTFDENIDKLLEKAKAGEGEAVAWTDVMLLAHELRSRVDDLDDQQRRALRELGEWQLDVSDRIGSLRDDIADEVVRRLDVRLDGRLDERRGD